MATGDFYKVNTYSTFAGQQCQNEFWYLQGTGTGNAAELAEAFLDVVLATIRIIQSSVVFYNLIKVYNWNNDADFVELDLTGTNGLNTNTAHPPFCALAFSTPRKLSSMRAGQKRFAGALETYDVNGTINNAPYLAQMDDVATVMSDDLIGGTTSTPWGMVIVKRVLTTVGSKQYYKVPKPIGAGQWYPADSWSKSVEVTSQVSRKVGRGA